MHPTLSIKYLASIGTGLLLLLFAAFNITAAQKITDLGALELGKPVLQELAGGDVHSYRIHLDEGQFLNVAVDQRRAFVLRAFDIILAHGRA